MTPRITKERPKDLHVDIMGMPWIITWRTQEEDEKLLDYTGYCDESARLIVIEWYADDYRNRSSVAAHTASIVRHEMIHAMLFECGLDSSTHKNWAKNEEMVDWIALLLPRLANTIIPVSDEVCRNIQKDLTSEK